jgi:hypothetical protein
MHNERLDNSNPSTAVRSSVYTKRTRGGKTRNANTILFETLHQKKTGGINEMGHSISQNENVA